MTQSVEASVGTRVQLSKVEVAFGDGPEAVQALDRLDLHIEAGEFVSVLGPSGCGKSTIISAIAGFRRVGAGELAVDAQPVTGPGRDRGVVFQQPMLFPWKSVLANVEFGLKMQGASKRERQKAATELLCHVGLGRFLNHYPHQLSGGMQQRVALARALITRPRVLLMDEPFSALDPLTRLHMQEMLVTLWAERHMTVVFVTHDVDEAVFLSDRVVVLTQRPARVKAELLVDIPRPRNQTTLLSPAFAELRSRALELFLAESRLQVASG